MLTQEIHSLMAQELAAVLRNGCLESVLLLALILRDGDRFAFAQGIELLMKRCQLSHDHEERAELDCAVAMAFAQYVYWVEGHAPLPQLMNSLEHLGVPARFRWPGAAQAG